MMVTKTFEVTWKHIAKGQTGECGACPIALALLEGGMERVRVEETHIHFLVPGNLLFTSRKMSQKLRDFVAEFDDSRESVEPFTFKLRMKVPG